MILAGFNGLIIWIYQNAGLGLAASIGIFLAGLGLAAIRRRGGQLSLLVGYIQVLMIISIAAAVYSAIRTSVVTGLQTGGIVFGCLAILNGFVVWYLLLNKPRTIQQHLKFFSGLATTLVVTAGSVIYLHWDYCQEHTACATDPLRTDNTLVQDVVVGLISTGQHYNESADHWLEFMVYVCEGYEDDIRGVFDRYSNMDYEVDLIEGSLRVDQRDESATVTAKIRILDNYLNSPFPGVGVWVFELLRIAETGRWCVSSISESEIE